MMMKTIFFNTRAENPRIRRRKKHSPKQERVHQRSSGLCHYCNSKNAFVFDHVIPKSRGGTNDEDNLVLACWACNSSKGKKGYLEFMEYIKAEMVAYEMCFQFDGDAS